MRTIPKPRARDVAAIVLMLISLTACTPHRQPATLYQTSTIQALLEGVYDSDITVAEVLRHGDLGLGTFDALDGEMIVLDGRAYRVPISGRAQEVSGPTPTPFAAVIPFDAADRTTITELMSFEQLEKRLDALRKTNNAPYAIRIDGIFAKIRTRSVPPQTRPFKRLADAVKEQATFDLANVEGTLVGFWFPPTMSTLNVPGYHFHFLTADRSAGGHLLSCEISGATVRVVEAAAVHVRLPTNSTYRNARLEQSPAAEVRGIER